MRKWQAIVLMLTLAALLAPAAGAHTEAGTRANGPSFSGNGGRNLPPFRVSVASTLFWSSNGAIFQTFSSGLSGYGNVNSQAHRGWTYLPAGRYQLQVNAIGNWTIRVNAGTVRPVSLGGGLIGYHGNGGTALPPFTTRHGGNLVWASSGEIFQVFAKEYAGGGDVNSQAHKGSSYLNAGRHTLTVNATGSWTLGWRR
jgi:hypothetical protein